MELPTTDELDDLANRLFADGYISRDILMAIGAIWECVALRHAVDHAIETCSDMATVVYLRDMREKTKQ